jgi:hypothetical protein
MPQLISALAPEEPLPVWRARTLKELAAAQFWQMAIAGIGIAVAGYFLFAEKFMGTPAEMAAIFFWGFGLDVSVDKLLQLAGGVSGAS